MTAAPLREAVAGALKDAFCDGAPARLGVAVSGGGDSMALLKLLADWAQAAGTSLFAATVDHGLRPEAADEARLVGQVAARLSVPHDILRWQNWDGQGNLQAMARQARLELLMRWAEAKDVPAVCMAHTLEDQAETVLLRLARGSGVDGLSGMRSQRRLNNGVRVLRPLLGAGRRDLRDFLKTQNIPWVEDPSNDNPAFTRVQARKILADPPLKGLDSETLADTADRMAAARRVLEAVAYQAAQQALHVTSFGAIQLDAPPFWALENETRWRLLSHALKVLSGNFYRPRLTALRHALDSLKDGRTASLHGCLMLPKSDRILVVRELSDTDASRPVSRGKWDKHWRISGRCAADTCVRALAQEGWEQLTPLERRRVPHAPALVLPSVWKSGVLQAAPLLKQDPNWTFNLLLTDEVVHEALLSH